MKPQTLTGFERYGKTTRRERFLADVDRVIPWPELTAAVQTVYPKISEAGGRPPIPLERMLRIYFASWVTQYRRLSVVSQFSATAISRAFSAVRRINGAL